MPAAAPGTALVVTQPQRRPDPIVRHGGEPDAGFVVQLIATAEPLDTDTRNHSADHGTSASAAYRATADRAGHHRARNGGLITSRSA